MESVIEDVRHALRGLGKSPAFGLAVVLSIAFGIGANTAIYTLAHALLFQKLPADRPEELVQILTEYPGEPRQNCCSAKWFEHFRQHNRVLTGLAGVAPASVTVSIDGGEAETMTGEFITSDYFSLLGMRPAAGRLEGEGAILSHTLWQNRFRGDPNVAGKAIGVNGTLYPVIGVAPAAYTGIEAGVRVSLWLPAVKRPHLAAIGRLKPNVPVDQAGAAFQVLFEPLRAEMRQNSKDPLLGQMKLLVEPAAGGVSRLGARFAQPLKALWAITGLLLAIACANVGGLLLARGAARRQEMAIRVSLGAGRGRLVRQVLTESAVIAGIGGALGLVISYIGAGWLVHLMLAGRRGPGMPERFEIATAPDLHVFLYAMAVAAGTALLFGLMPACSAFLTAPASAIQESGRGGESKLQRRAGFGLVSLQVGVSAVLLSAASLFVGYLAGLRNVDLGFRRDHVLLASLNGSGSGYNRVQLTQAFRELLPRVRAIPGVRSATIAAMSPLSGAGASRFVTVSGRTEAPQDRRYVSLNWVAPGYFETMAIPLLNGREFANEDANRSRIAIASNSFARYYFPDGDAIGKLVNIDGEGQPYEIVGVAGDAHYTEIRETPPRTLYLHMFQDNRVGMQFILRTAVEPTSISGAFRGIVKEALPSITVAKTTTLDEQVEGTLVPEKMIASLSSVFGGLGAALAALGLYGLLAYSVSRRVREIGVRMALGASPGSVARMVIHEALRMLAAGICIGLPAAYAARRAMGSAIPDLPENVAAPLLIAGVLIAATGICAAYLPARRAAAVEPVVALRCD